MSTTSRRIVAMIICSAAAAIQFGHGDCLGNVLWLQESLAPWDVEGMHQGKEAGHTKLPMSLAVAPIRLQ